MYYNINIKKEYTDSITSGLMVLNLSTPATDGGDAVLRKLDNTAVDSRTVSGWSYTLSSVSVCKELSNPNYLSVELTIKSIKYESIREIKDAIRSQFVDAEVTLTLIYSKVYDRDKEMPLASKHRVINASLSNISRTADSATVNVKLDIYSPDYYATLNVHSESFTGKQFGEIVTTAITRFPHLKDRFDEVTTIQKSYNLYYKYDTKSTTESVDDDVPPVVKNNQKTTTYKFKTEENDIIIPHIVPYSVQYNESTYDFLRRLSRRFGETLYFEEGCLRVGIHPKKEDATSLSAVVSTISFSEQTDSQASVYVGGNYHTDTTTSFKQYGSSEDKTVYNVVNQEVGTDEMNVDILSTIDTKWAEDNPKYDNLYLDYIGETDSETDKIDQEDRYDIVNNSIVYWPSITVRLIYQILTFKLTEPDKYAEFFLENAMSIYESYRLVGEINEGHYKHTETTEYKYKRYFKNTTTTTTYTEQYTKSLTNNVASDKGSAVAGSKTNSVITGPTGITVVAAVAAEKSDTKKLIDGVRHVDSPRGLAEIMCKSDLALTSFIVKTSAEAGRNVIKVVLQTSNDLTSDKYSVVVGLRLGSIVTLDDGGDRYVVSKISTYSSGDSTSTPVVEIDLLPTVKTSYNNILGKNKISMPYDIEVAIPYFTADDMIRRAEPQRAIVIDVRDSRKLNRARVCYPWQYATNPTETINTAVTQMSDGRGLNTVARKTELKDNLKLNASPWLRVSSPGHKGGGTGFVSAPGVDTEVMVCYESGNIERPYISGSLFTGPGTALMGHQISDVSTFGSRYGRKIMVCDTAVGGGSSILTSFFPFTSLFGIEAKGAVGEALDGYIQIGDQYGLCSLNMSSTTRAISISTPMGKVNISALTGINIVAPSGDINISGKNVNIMAENNLNIMSGTRVGRMRKASAEYSGKSVKDKIFTALGKAAMGAVEWGIGELIDLSLVRTIFECFVAPVGGTMVIKSHRYLCIEGGAGRASIPTANGKCFVSQVLTSFLRVFDPIDGWRYRRYVKCYKELREELIGSAANDKNSLIYKFFGNANGGLSDGGTALRNYIVDRIVAPEEFPANAAHTFEFDGDDGYGRYLATEYNDAQNAPHIGYTHNICTNRGELRYKLMMMRHAFRDYKQFLDCDTWYHVDSNNKANSIIESRINSMSEKYDGVGVKGMKSITDGIRNLVITKLFNGAGNIPTYDDLKDPAGNYGLVNQAMFGLPPAQSAAKKIILLILMRMITGTVLEKYDICSSNFAGITADNLFKQNFIKSANNNIENIRDVLNEYIGDGVTPSNAQQADTLNGKNALTPAQVAIVNSDWAKLCNGFSLGLDLNRESLTKSAIMTGLEIFDSASGLEMSKTVNESVFPTRRIRSDRRVNDTGTILMAGSPGSTVKFNPTTAMFEKVAATTNVVDAAFLSAMLSI